MKTTTISDFKANVILYVDTIINDNSTLLINKGNTAAILISLEEYNSIKATENILASPNISDEVIMGIEQWKNGKSIEVDLDLL